MTARFVVRGMRIKTVSVGSLLLCACAGTPREPTDAAWAEFVRSELLEVRVERRLYQQSGNPHFLIRVRLTNRTDSALGVDLRDGSRQIGTRVRRHRARRNAFSRAAVAAVASGSAMISTSFPCLS